MSPCQLCHPGDKCFFAPCYLFQLGDRTEQVPCAQQFLVTQLGDSRSPQLSLRSAIAVLGGWLPIQPLSCSPCQLLCCKRRRGGFDF